MGFFSNLFRGRDAPSNSTAGSGYGLSQWRQPLLF